MQVDQTSTEIASDKNYYLEKVVLKTYPIGMWTHCCFKAFKIFQSFTLSNIFVMYILQWSNSLIQLWGKNFPGFIDGFLHTFLKKNYA